MSTMRNAALRNVASHRRGRHRRFIAVAVVVTIATFASTVPVCGAWKRGDVDVGRPTASLGPTREMYRTVPMDRALQQLETKPNGDSSLRSLRSGKGEAVNIFSRGKGGKGGKGSSSKRSSKTSKSKKSESPSAAPTISFAPTAEPSQRPSPSPTISWAPSDVPTRAPSTTPSVGPSASPSALPSEKPSVSPSGQPSQSPSEAPSESPSQSPSEVPSARPSSSPSISVAPSVSPTGAPSPAPTISAAPSTVPSSYISGPRPSSCSQIVSDTDSSVTSLGRWEQVNCATTMTNERPAAPQTIP